MEFTNTTIVLLVIIICLLACLVYALFYIQKLKHQHELQAQKQNNHNPNITSTKPDQPNLQLAAYERLTLFAERTKLDNLVNRLYNSNYSAVQMQQVLTNAIAEEYDYNLTQQLYIKPQVWEAVTKLKEQNIFILNQIGNTVAPNATAADFNTNVSELLRINDSATMNNVVINALQFESKLLLQ
jgi:hypothetical protein